MVAHLQYLHPACGQLVGQLIQLLGLGVAGEQGRPLRRPVAIAVPGGEQAEAVGIAAIVGQSLGPEHRYREFAAAHRIARRQLDEGVGESLCPRCGHELRACFARAVGKSLGHQQRRCGSHIPEHGKRSAVVVVAVGDGHSVEAAHSLARQGGLEQGILVAGVDE